MPHDPNGQKIPKIHVRIHKNIKHKMKYIKKKREDITVLNKVLYRNTSQAKLKFTKAGNMSSRPIINKSS